MESVTRPARPSLEVAHARGGARPGAIGGGGGRRTRASARLLRLRHARSARRIAGPGSRRVGIGLRRCCTSTRTSSPTRCPPAWSATWATGMRKLTSARRRPTPCSSTAHFHRDEFLRAAADLLAAMPDERSRLGWCRKRSQRAARCCLWGAICAASTSCASAATAAGGRRRAGRWGDSGRGPADRSGTSAGSTTRPRATFFAGAVRAARKRGTRSGWPWRDRTKGCPPRSSSRRQRAAGRAHRAVGAVWTASATTPRFCGRPTSWCPRPSTSSSAWRWWRPCTAAAGRCCPGG